MTKAAIAVRQDISAETLRKKARQVKDGRVVSRMMAIANILDGKSRAESAYLAGMTRRTLSDWVHRYNESGIDGLQSHPTGHRARRLLPEQETELEKIIEAGPCGTLARWRCVDLKEVIEENFNVVYHKRSVGKLLHRLGFARMTARPVHPKGDAEAQESFKKTSPRASKKSCPNQQKTSPSKSGFRTKRASDKKEI